MARSPDNCDTDRTRANAIRGIGHVDATDRDHRNTHRCADLAQAHEPDGRIGVGLRRRLPDRAGSDVVGGILRLARLLECRSGESEQEAVVLRALRSVVAAAQVHPFGAELERSLNVVVDDECHAGAGAQAPRRPPALDDVDLLNVLQAPLHHRGATVDCQSGGFELVHDRVQLHEILVRESSVSGSSPASASYRATWKEPGPDAPRAASSAATPNDASASAAASSGASRFAARKQPVIALDMQPVPVTDASSSLPFATASTRSPSDTWSTGPVTDATRSSLRAAARAISARSSAAPIDSTPRTSASTPTSVATSPWLPRSTDTFTCSRTRLAVSVRYLVAPAPTGSKTTGTPCAFAALPARSIASTDGGESVRMLSTSSPPSVTISSTSSRA